MQMLVNVGMAVLVEAESVEEAEFLVESYITDGVTLKEKDVPTDSTVAVALWCAGDYDKETRQATLHARNLRAQTEPEFGLLPAGKKLLESNLQELAEQQAQMVAEEIVSKQISDN